MEHSFMNMGWPSQGGTACVSRSSADICVRRKMNGTREANKRTGEYPTQEHADNWI